MLQEIPDELVFQTERRFETDGNNNNNLTVDLAHLESEYLEISCVRKLRVVRCFPEQNPLLMVRKKDSEKGIGFEKPPRIVSCDQYYIPRKNLMSNDESNSNKFCSKTTTIEDEIDATSNAPQHRRSSSVRRRRNLLNEKELYWFENVRHSRRIKRQSFRNNNNAAKRKEKIKCLGPQEVRNVGLIPPSAPYKHKLSEKKEIKTNEDLSTIIVDEDSIDIEHPVFQEESISGLESQDLDDVTEAQQPHVTDNFDEEIKIETVDDVKSANNTEDIADLAKADLSGGEVNVAFDRDEEDNIEYEKDISSDKIQSKPINDPCGSPSESKVPAASPSLTIPIVFFIHSYGQSSDCWKYQMDYFVNSGFEVVSPDLIGHGMSSAPLEELESESSNVYSFSAIFSDILVTFDHYVYVGRPCIIVAHSLCCSYAVALAKSRPASVSCLVLIASGSPFVLHLPQSLFSQVAKSSKSAKRRKSKEAWGKCSPTMLKINHFCFKKENSFCKPFVKFYTWIKSHIKSCFLLSNRSKSNKKELYDIKSSSFSTALSERNIPRWKSFEHLLSKSALPQHVRDGLARGCWTESDANQVFAVLLYGGVSGGVNSMLQAMPRNVKNCFVDPVAFYRRSCAHLPVLLVYGMRDEQVSLVDMCEMERILGSKTYLEILPSASHFVMNDESGEELSHMIEKFVHKVLRGP